MLSSGVLSTKMVDMDRSELPPHVPAVIGYEHKYRVMYVTEVFRSRAGRVCIRAWDPDVEEGAGGWRTFREDRLIGSIHLLR
jgi:hypothetical protein